MSTHRKRPRQVHSYSVVSQRRCWLGKTPVYGRTYHSNNPSLGKDSVGNKQTQSANATQKHVKIVTSGISTAKSTPNLPPSLPFTLTLFAQLPTNVISVGFSNDTFQFVSSVGRGNENGIAIPFLRRERAAVSGCWAATGGSEVKNV